MSQDLTPHAAPHGFVVADPGPTSSLQWQPQPISSLLPHQIRIQIHATAVNRADLLQRRGLYPPPPLASEVLGLECAGCVVEVGSDAAHTWRIGDRAMALLAGGGYAQECVVDAGLALPIPPAWSYVAAGAFMETALTAYLNLLVLGQGDLAYNPNPKDAAVLIHGGSGGVGTAAIALARAAGLIPWVTAGSDARCQRCLEIGAQAAFNYQQDSWPKAIAEAQKRSGYSITTILDCVGGAYLEQNLRLLASDGRLVIIGLQGGRQSSIDLAWVLKKRLQIIGSTLRNLATKKKISLIQNFWQRFSDAAHKGQLDPIIDTVYPIHEANQAHAHLQKNRPFGKIALQLQ